MDFLVTTTAIHGVETDAVISVSIVTWSGEEGNGIEDGWDYDNDLYCRLVRGCQEILVSDKTAELVKANCIVEMDKFVEEIKNESTGI